MHVVFVVWPSMVWESRGALARPNPYYRYKVDTVI